MNRIKALRAKHNMKQAELAAAVNVSQAALSGYENEKYEAEVATYKAIADFFGVSLDYLLGREEKAPDAAEAASGDVSEVEKELIRCAGQLTGEQKGFLLTVARSLLGQGQAPRPDPPETADETQ